MCIHLSSAYSKCKFLFCVWTELSDCRIKCTSGEWTHRIIPEFPHKKHKLQSIQPQNTVTTNHSQLVVTTCLWLCKSRKASSGANKGLIDLEPKKRKGMWAECVKTHIKIKPSILNTKEAAASTLNIALFLLMPQNADISLYSFPLFCLRN